MSSEKLERTVRIVNPNGLHMRPSAAFATLAMRYPCRVTVLHDGRTADGKSALDMMTLCAMPDTEVTVRVEGPDAKVALDALAELLAAPGPEG